MKKSIVCTLVLLLSVSAVDVVAQSLLKNLKNAVEKEVVNRVKQEVDKGLNKLKDAADQIVQPVLQEGVGQQLQTQYRPPQLLDAEAIAPMVEYGPRSGSIGGHEWVDMGLPSGTRWATCNVETTSPEQPGKLYAWGEVTTKSSYTPENHKYYGKEMDDFSGDSAYDIATAKWGEGWRMPTEDEFSELLFYCDWKYEQQGGRWGSIITSPTTGNSIFLPVTGYKEDTSHHDASGNGLYWTSTPYSDQYNNGAYMYQFGAALGEVSIGDRGYGYAVRAVADYDVDTSIPTSGEIEGHAYVDLGLPSGLKWATVNLGSDAVDQDGDYYAWGEVTKYLDKKLEKNKMYGTESGDISGSATHDAATAEWGGTWRIPTEEEFYELIDNCTFEWTTIGRRIGMKVTSKSNGNYIFLPASGRFRSSSPVYNRADDINEYANYWTSTPERGSYSYEAYTFSIFNAQYSIPTGLRYHGYTIRPVSE